MKLLKYISTLVLSLLPCLFANGQSSATIHGAIYDSSSQLPLKNAFISLTRASDSSIQHTLFSGEKGAFSIERVSAEDYYLRISYQGYQTRNISFRLYKTPLDLGIIQMTATIKVLDTIVIREPPVVFNKDTLEYNAGQFKTRDYAALEELLKILPGIQLNNDGTITINGKVVDQLMVDGKPFFDGSPSTALTHLPADIIRKIQVYASNTASANGLPFPPGFGGPQTLNIVLKANKRKGSFGKIMAGAGPEGVYSSSGNLSYMNGGQQLSLIGDAGNVNADNNNGEMASGGIMRQINGGINYRDSRNNKTSITLSALENNQYNKTRQQSHVLNIFPGASSVTRDQQSEDENHTDLKQFNLSLEHKINDYNIFVLQPKIMLQRGDNNGTLQSLQRYKDSGDTMYRSAGNNSSANSMDMFSSLIQYTHKWKDPAKRFVSGINIRHNDIDFNTTGNSEIITNSSNTNLHLYNTNQTKDINLSPFIQFSTSAGKKNILNIQGSYSVNRHAMSYRAYRFNEESEHTKILDSSQSNDYTTTYKTAAMQFAFSRQWKKTSLSVGTGMQSDWLNGENKTSDSRISSHYLNVLPSATFNLQLKEHRQLQTSYNGKPVMVSVELLQPVSVTSDSLFISEGNPDLKQPYSHTFSIGYNAVGSGNNSFFSTSISHTMTLHDIESSTTLLDNGAQISKPVNIGVVKSVSAMVTYGLPRIGSNSGINFSGNASYSKRPVISNGIRNDVHLITVMTSISYNYYQPEGFAINIRVAPGYNSMNTALGSKQHYFTAGLSTKISYIKRDLETSIISYYNHNSMVLSRSRQLYPIVNPGIAYRVLKHKEGSIRISVSDLFNQQSGVSASITSTSVTDSWTQTRGRYLIVTFAYNFRKFGNK